MIVKGASYEDPDADQYYTPSAILADIADNTGLALYSTSTRANFAAGNRLDAAGFTGAPVQDREGTGLTAIAVADVDISYGRLLASGLPQDTNNNAADFTLVSPGGSVGATLTQIGAPGPENLASAINRTTTIPVTLFDLSAAATASPNRVRDLTDIGVNKDFGTLTLRRRFTNDTGQTLTRLRFRVISITTLNSPGYVLGGSQADVRLLDSGNVTITALTVNGTQVELPPLQPKGGGLFTTADVLLPETGLTSRVAGTCPVASQCTLDVQFKLGVVQPGTFRFFVNIEALP